MKINKKLQITAVVLLAVLSFGCSKKDYSDKPELKLLIVGDSLSAAYQINPNDSWTKLLQDKFDENAYNVKIKNISESGDRTSDAFDNHDDHLASKPDIVIMNIGANDALKRVPVNETKQNYTHMVESFIGSETKPDMLLVNIKPPEAVIKAAPFVKSYLTIVPEIASSHNVAYMEDFFDELDTGLINNKHFLPDRVHPNEKAQPILAENIYEAIVPLIEKRYTK